jgi:hypothetical protein
MAKQSPAKDGLIDRRTVLGIGRRWPRPGQRCCAERLPKRSRDPDR